jgi:hypothetical protein
MTPTDPAPAPRIIVKRSARKYDEEYLRPQRTTTAYVKRILARVDPITHRYQNAEKVRLL